MHVYKFWRQGALIIPVELTEASDAELVEVIAECSGIGPCGHMHPEIVEQAQIIQLARAKGWPVEPVK